MVTTVIPPASEHEVAHEDLPPLSVTTVGIPAQERLDLPVATAAPEPRPRSRSGRNALVIGSLILSAVLLALWAVLGAAALDAMQSGMTRGYIPGTVSVSVHEGDWYVYSEPSVPGTTVSVTTPGGVAVPVTPLDLPASYQAGAVQIASFHVGPAQAGEVYTVTATNSRTTVATMAVGSTDLTSMTPVVMFWLTMLVLAVDIAVLAMIVPLPGSGPTVDVREP